MADYEKELKIKVDIESAMKSLDMLRGTFKKINKQTVKDFVEIYQLNDDNVKKFQQIVDLNRKLSLAKVLNDSKKIKEMTDEMNNSLLKFIENSGDAGEALLNMLHRDDKDVKEQKMPYKQALRKDMKKGLVNLNPFNEERRNKWKEDGKYNTVIGAAVGKIGNHFGKVMVNMITNIGKFFYNTFKKSFEELAKIGSYDAGTTLISDREKRERQLTFGLTGGQNYAMFNAMKILNMTSIEDLMWANAKQTEQYNRITEILEAQYNKLESSGILETTQQFQIDMALMKLQFQNTVYSFIAAHRGAIEKVLDLSFAFMEQVLNFLGTIADGIAFLYGGNRYAESDTLSASSTSNVSNTDNSRVITATVNYTNNQAAQESQSAFSESAMNQLIAVLNG